MTLKAIFTKKQKSEKKTDLIPKGVYSSVIPNSYLKAFPFNDLSKIPSKETKYLS